MMIPPYQRGGISMVPETFAPSVSEDARPMVPAAAPGVRPMQNAAPGQLLQTGQTLEQMGALETKVGNTIGDAVRNTVDDAQTKSAVNQFLQTSTPLLSKYRTTEGLDATQQFEPTAQGIIKALEDARATLTNPVQQHMFDQVTSNHMLSFQGQMADHKNIQQVQYGKQQASDYADNLHVQARTEYLNGDMAAYRRDSAQADAETLHVAQLSGIAPDSPTAQAMLQAKRSTLAVGIFAGLHDRGAYNEAHQYLQSVQGNLDMRSSEMLNNADRSMMRQEAAKTDVQNAAMAALGMKGPGVLQAPMPGATISTTPASDGGKEIYLQAAQGTSVHAPSSGTVTKVWNDPKMGLSAQISLSNGYTATLGNLSAVNYEEGQKITQGQVLGLSGKQMVAYAMADASGRSMDPREAGSAPLDPRNFSTPEQEEKAVNWIHGNVADPDEQFQAESGLRRLADSNRGILTQEHAAALKQATDYWFPHGGLTGLPAEVKMHLTAQDMEGFEARGVQRYDLGQSEKRIAEQPILQGWTQHPETMTVDAVRTAYAQGKLSDSSYLASLREATHLQGSDTGHVDPQKAAQAQVDTHQLTNILEMNNLPDLAHPSAKVANSYSERSTLEYAIRNEIQRQQDNAKRPLTWQEKGKIMRDMVTDKVYTNGSASGLMPFAAATSQEQQNATVWVRNQQVRMADIPPQYALQATEDLRANRLPTTQANIAAWWLKKGKPVE